LRVVVIASDGWLEAALAHELSGRRGWTVVTQSSLSREVRSRADVVVFDEGSWTEALDFAALADIGCRVVLVTKLTRSHLEAANASGGVHFVERSRGPRGVVELLDRIAGDIELEPKVSMNKPTGQVALSSQERRVLAFMAQGATAAQIAVELGITRGTVSAYLKRIRTKGLMAGRSASNRAEIFRLAVDEGLIQVRPDVPLLGGFTRS